MEAATNDLSSRLAFDTQGLGNLKQAAKAGSPEALKSAATQFEAMFINMMMKSMRDATPQDGPMDSQQTKTFTSMLDQQTSQNLAKRGMGLADVLVRQLGSQAANLQAQSQALAIGSDGSAMPAPKSAEAMMSTPGALATTVASSGLSSGISASGRVQAPHVRAFQDQVGPDAEAASKATGIPAKFMIGQAALETGWGKRVISNADGSSSHNLFGIKAGAGWTGKVATAVTTEYVNGVPHTRLEKFRAYDSYADSFKDYAKLLSDNPRYEKVLASAGDPSKFAHGLQKAGYATDPLYAAKLSKIISHSLG
ncbi:flagellar assembly peptidoglycan hydrolase FlgJ [Massilia sp. PWRC2]|uniref:flagellar assembly peptidoglycan hydrolase FlgJ n=1 Tax=Massilia sp. PWRC2 TaxID=2804626 RepID=UPI003CF1CA8B